MPVVSMPDGSVVNFPDGTSTDDMNAALAGWQPKAQASASAPANGQITGPARLPLKIGSDLVSGTAALASLPRSIMALGDEYLPNFLTRPLGSAPGTKPGAIPWPNVSAGTDALGLTHRNDLKPQNAGERYMDAGVEAVPAAVAAVASGGGSLLPMLASGEAGALAAQGAHDLAPDSKWAPVVAGLAGGLASGGVVNSVENALTRRSTTKAVTDAADALQAAKDAKFEGATAIDQHAAGVKAASAKDFAATRQMLADDLAAHHAQQDGVIETVASGLGKSQTLQDAGTSLQAGARDWLTNTLPDKLDEVWAPVNAAIPKDMPLPLAQFTDALGSINKSAGALEPLASLLKPSLPARLGKVLESKGDLEEMDPGAAPGQYSWGDVAKLRSTLGDAMSNPKTVADVGAKNMSRLYAALTTDMRVGADRAGAVPLFDAANQESQRLYQIAEGPMSRVVAGPRASVDDPAPEAVAKSLLTGAKSGASALAVLRQEIPQGLNELAAAQLRLDPSSIAKASPEALGALLPDSNSAATVLASLSAKERAAVMAKTGVKLAQQQHQDNVTAATAAAKAGKLANTTNVRSSSAALAAAKAKLAAIPPANALAHGVGGLFGSQVGNELAILALKSAGLPGSDLVHGAIGSLVGAGAPAIYRGVKGIVQNPRRLVHPALGGVEGTNQLYSPPNQ